MSEEQKFKITDRRGFAEDGTPKPVDEKPVEAPATASGQQEKSSGQQNKPGDDYQPIDFSTFVLSYATQGFVLLGEAPNPYTDKIEEDVESVRHIIDLLSMIEQKTKGNLSGEENRLLESVLYELRMKYMTKTSRIKV